MCAILLHTLYRVKEPAFLLLLVVGCIVAWACRSMGVLSLSIEGSVSSNMGFLTGTAVVLAFGVVVALLVGATEIPRDISTNMIAILLGKPLGRGSYVWGKILGVTILAFGSSAFWLTILLIARVVAPGYEEPITLGFLGILHQYSSLLLLLPVCAISVGFSCFLGDLGAMIFSFIYLGGGLMMGIVPHVIRVVPPPINQLLLVPYYMFPNVSYFLSPLDIVGFIALCAYALIIAAGFGWLGRAAFVDLDI